MQATPSGVEGNGRKALGRFIGEGNADVDVPPDFLPHRIRHQAPAACVGPDRREELFRYIWGVHKNLSCMLYRINGVEDHLHILTGLHPTVALAESVKTVKLSSSDGIKRERVFPHITNWQVGYGAFTASYAEKDALIEYIKNQEEHHRRVSFQDELKRLLAQAGVVFDEKYLNVRFRFRFRPPAANGRCS